MSSEDQQGIITPAAMSQLGAGIGAKSLAEPNLTTSIPTPPPLPETLTAEQKKARRKAAEEKRRAEQAEQEKREAEKKAIEEQAKPARKNSMSPVIIEDSFREAMARRNAQIEGEDNGDDWDEEDDVIVSASPIVATASVNVPTPPQEQIEAPKVSVKEGRSELLQAIRAGVKLKKQDTSKEQTKVASAATVVSSDEKAAPALIAAVAKATPKLPGNLLADLAKGNKAGLKPIAVEHTKAEAAAPTPPEVEAPAPSTVKTSHVLDELQQNARFKAAKERSENAVASVVTPAVAATPLETGKDEWNQGFNRIRQRNIPFQYVPEADLKKGIDAFHQKKAAKTGDSIVEAAPNPVVVSEPKMTVSSKPAATVDTDRDYALALHLDELQRSDKASDRALADNPEYIRSLQETYDNENKRDTKAFNQLDAPAQKEVQHQNLEKEVEVQVVAKPTLRAPQRPRDQYIAQSVSLTFMILVEHRSFELNGVNANLFMSCSCICLSYHESLSINENGKVSYNRSQSLSYTQTNITVSDNGESVVSTNLAISYNEQVSMSACRSISFFGKSAAIPAAMQTPRINMDNVSPIGLPAAAAA